MTEYTRNLAAGGLFVAVGTVFLTWSALSLRMGTLAQMGPGFFPTVLGGLLCVFGVAVAVSAWLRHRSRPASPVDREPWQWRPILLVGLSPIVFALSIERLGLVPATFLTLMMVLLASPPIGIIKRIAIAAGFTAFCVVIFKYGLGVSISLFWT